MLVTPALNNEAEPPFVYNKMNDSSITSVEQLVQAALDAGLYRW